MNALRLSVGDSVLEGILVPYHGEPDTYGTTFGPPGTEPGETDYCLDWLRERPLLLEHALSDQDGDVVPVGRIGRLWSTAAGLMMRATLDKTSKFYETIRSLVSRGRLFLSSGAMQHLVATQPVQSGGRSALHVTRWPLIEGSLVRNPSSQRTPITAAEFRAHCRAAGISYDEQALRRREVAALERYCLDMQAKDLRRWARGWGLVL